MPLRDYQAKAVESAMQFFNRHRRPSDPVKPGILVAPTAAGKSHIIAAIAARLDRILILQPSIELLRQNLSKYIANGGQASIYSAGANSRQVGNVTYATLGSIKTKGAMFQGYALMIDEAHLYPPKVESMLGQFMLDSRITRVLGLTATPFRLKSSRYSSELKFITRMRPRFFKEVIHVIQVQEMTARGYWSTLKYKPYDFNWTGLKAKKNGSDYTEESMHKVWAREGMDGVIGEIVARMRKAGRKSILIFVPSVDGARDLAAKIPGGLAVWGNMPKPDRALAIESFKQGRTPVVVNVNVLSVGFDHPGIDAIIVARPTMSLAWYYQAIGRGTRIMEGKQDCWIADVSGNFQKFGRIENLTVDEVPGYGWGVFGTNNERLLTGVPMESRKVIIKGKIVSAKQVRKATAMYY